MVASSPENAGTGGLPLRILSSLLMIPAMLAAIYVGSPVFDGFIVVVAAVLIWEWQGLLAPGDALLRATAMAGTCVAVGSFALTFGWTVALACAVATALAVAALAIWRGTPRPFLVCLGPLYVAVPCLAVLVLRRDFGFVSTAWLFVMVWATDTGAYAFGKTIGGPKLAPRISPNKTWAGLAGGMICAAAVGAAAAALGIVADARILPLALFGAGLAVVAQVGDLFESAVKRCVGAKDSSRLIPGHGGVLDRVDGVMTAAPVALWVFGMMRDMGAMG